jgi:hypothetical protein
MALSIDRWISTHSPIEPERLHALGVVTLYWNECEYELFLIFGEVLALPLPQLWALAHDLGDIAISTRIMALARAKKFDEAALSALENALAVYDVCRRNRNQLTHFWAMGGIAGGRTLYHRSKKPDDYFPDLFDSKLEDIRRVAEEIMALRDHLFQLEGAINGIGRKAPGAPWPSKLPVPKLLYEPPPPIPTKPKHRPQSSRP